MKEHKKKKVLLIIQKYKVMQVDILPFHLYHELYKTKRSVIVSGRAVVFRMN